MSFLYNDGNIQKFTALPPAKLGVSGAVLIWNEKVDGFISPELKGQIGGLIKNGGVLEFSQARLDQHVAALATQATTESQRDARIQQAKTFLAGLDTSSPLTTAQLTNAVRAIIVLLKDLNKQV